jgi:hypothetical protein
MSLLKSAHKGRASSITDREALALADLTLADIRRLAPQITAYVSLDGSTCWLPGELAEWNLVAEEEVVK